MVFNNNNIMEYIKNTSSNKQKYADKVNARHLRNLLHYALQTIIRWILFMMKEKKWYISITRYKFLAVNVVVVVMQLVVSGTCWHIVWHEKDKKQYSWPVIVHNCVI